MAMIHILVAQVSNMIAAGEVVERPASVVKEIMENSIDAESSIITVEIKGGGSYFIRVSDNGKGMSREDVKMCLLRHATSKIKTAEDLNEIITLGFRGEALAAISAVSRVEIVTKRREDPLGVRLESEGGKILNLDEAGCPDGTVVTVKDLFFNTPARRKFLKKDTTETSVIAQYVERIALSHPDIAIKFIVDGRVRFATPGDGSLHSAVYAVYGKDFIEDITEVSGESEGIAVKGYISLPEKSRTNRNMQIFYINGRLVRSKTLTFALEDAYKSYIMTERHPVCILFISINPALADINVHPSKLEVKFSDEHKVYSALYLALKDTLDNLKNDIAFDLIKTRTKKEEPAEQITFAKKAEIPDEAMAIEKTERIRKEEIKFDFTSAKPAAIQSRTPFTAPKKEEPPMQSGFVFKQPEEKVTVIPLKKDEPSFNAKEEKTDILSGQKPKEEPKEESAEYRLPVYRGIIFNAYIMAELEDNIYLIDKHAAHERILYEQLKTSQHLGGSQELLSAIVIELTSAEHGAAISFKEELLSAGFEIDDFGENTIVLRALPCELSELGESDIRDVVINLINDISSGASAKQKREDIFDRSLYTAACKAAMKAGRMDRTEDSEYIIEKLFTMENIKYCPHGRPVLKKYTKSEIEKIFFRT